MLLRPTNEMNGKKEIIDKMKTMKQSWLYMSIKCVPVIIVLVTNFKMPFFYILRLITRTNDSVSCSEQENYILCVYFVKITKFMPK